MENKLKVGIIGFGNMGSSIGLALQETKRWMVYVYDKDKRKLKGLKGFYICKDNREVIERSEVVILAIKPQDIRGFLDDTKECLLENKPLIITIAAGVPIKLFERCLFKPSSNKIRLKVIRAMPNLAAKVKQSVSFLCKGKFVNSTDLNVAKKIFSSIGEVFIIGEEFLDKVTSISGSGPGYVYYIMDCIYKTALQLGFKKCEARKMVALTFMGASKLASLTEKDFAILVREVASPKGTTEAALNIFKKEKLAKIIEQGVKSAYRRAKELRPY
jgi:pyrroline-5-carboxylate reductase